MSDAKVSPPWCWGPKWCDGGEACTCARPDEPPTLASDLEEAIELLDTLIDYSFRMPHDDWWEDLMPKIQALLKRCPPKVYPCSVCGGVLFANGHGGNGQCPPKET